MAIDRRTLLLRAAAGVVCVAGSAGAVGIAGLSGPAAAVDTGVRYVGVRSHPTDRRFVATVADAAGRTLHDLALPGRGHGFAVRPATTEAVVVARRPGRFAVAFDLNGAVPPRTFHAPSDRHFQGHAVLDRDGRHLFATENDFEGERGVIGVYAAADGYRRVGEVPSHGIGPHELALMPDGRTLAVGNGGILTHPDSGRAKLNIPTMAPSLAYVERGSGRLLDLYAPPPGRRRKLSIRHLAVLADGRVAFACQDQGAILDALPLVGVHAPGSGHAVDLAAPDRVRRAMAGYCGSVAVDRAGVLVAVSAPRGNRVVFWDGASGGCLGSVAMADGCGITAGPDPGTFMLSSGRGALALYDPVRPHVIDGPEIGSAPWDNHLAAVIP